MASEVANFALTRAWSMPADLSAATVAPLIRMNSADMKSASASTSLQPLADLVTQMANLPLSSGAAFVATAAAEANAAVAVTAPAETTVAAEAVAAPAHVTETATATATATAAATATATATATEAASTAVAAATTVAAPAVEVKAPPLETFPCPVCESDVDKTLSFLIGDDSSTCEHYLKINSCYHSVCRNCLAAWVTAQLSTQFYVRCPVENCKYKLYNDEIKELASEEDYKRLMEWQINTNLMKNEELTENEELKSFLDEYTKRCPHCFLMIERSEGCNVMLCVCGGSFCWACGEDCQYQCNQY